MNEASETLYVFEGPDDFVEFLLRNGGKALNEIEKKIPPVKNLCMFAKNFKARPCACKGKNPEEITKMRKERLNRFYERLVKELSVNFGDRFDGGRFGEKPDLKIFLKQIVLENNDKQSKVAFKLEDRILLEI